MFSEKVVTDDGGGAVADVLLAVEDHVDLLRRIRRGFNIDSYNI